MEKFITCYVCMEVYDEHLRCPRILQCGHSFCSTCIEKLLASRSECPICLMPIANGTLELISINYSLKELAENYSGKYNGGTSDKAMLEGSGSESQCQRALLPYEGFCELHKITQRFRCMTCTIWICGECVAISHKYCKTLLVEEAFKEMKEEHNNEILKHLEIISKSEEDIALILVKNNEILEENVEELECYQKKMIVIRQENCKVNCKIEKILNMQTVLKSLKEKLESQVKITSDVSFVKDLDVLKEQLTEHFTSLTGLVRNLEVLKSGQILESEVVGKTVETYKPTILHLSDELANINLNINKRIITDATFSQRGMSFFMTVNGTTRYGLAIGKNQEILMYCSTEEQIQTKPLILTMNQYLMTMFKTTKWPDKIFFQFTSQRSEVTINLNNETNEASKAVKTYLFGEEGYTFKDMNVVSSGGIVQSGSWTPLRGGEIMTPSAIIIHHQFSLNNPRMCNQTVQQIRMQSPDGANLICLDKFLPVPPNVDSNKLLKEVTRKKEWKEGEVALQIRKGINGLEFWLWIFIAESNEELELISAGQVESGIKDCQTVFQCNNAKQISVINCGLNLGII